MIPGLRTLRRGRIAADRDLTLGQVLERLADAHGGRTLVDEAGGRRLRVDEAAGLVDRWAGAIARRSAPGDVVVVATPNGYDQLLLCLAASRAGCIPAPVNDHMRPDEVDHVIADAGAVLVLRSVEDATDDGAPLGRCHPVEATALAALFYTSGTTGRPKGVELTHRGILGGLHSAALLPSGLRHDEALFSLPMAHIMGFITALGLACAAIPARFHTTFEPEVVLDELEVRRPFIFVGVPTMYRMLLEAGAEQRDLSSVRLWVSGADALPTDVAERFARLGAGVSLPLVGPLGRAVVAEGYGLVEASGGVAATVAVPYLPPVLGRLGVPLPGYRTRVVDGDGSSVGVGSVGELQITGPGVLRGYRGDDEATAAALTEDGWLRTGDLVRRGPFGVFSFEGRVKDVIVRGGFNVYAVEVEHALERHPAVVEAAVVGLPDERLGEVPVAAVRLAEGAAVDPEELRSWAHEELTGYKVPTRIEIVDDLPRSGTKKVQRAEVRLRLLDG